MELTNRTIFILGATKFDGNIESTSFNTAKYLAAKNDVYYIDFPYTHKDYFDRNQREFINKRKPYFKNATDGIILTDHPRLKIIILPLLLSINFLPEGTLYRLLLKWNEHLIANRLKKVIKERDVTGYIFINSFNFHYPHIGKLIKSCLKVYHCVDPIIVPYDMRHGFISENIVVAESDLVICTSKALFNKQKQINHNTFFIPNAADISLSSRALDESLPVHSLLKNVPVPVIGYFGAIERRMDFDLLKKVADANPDKSFVFVGPSDESFIDKSFREKPNVYFIGRVPYADMPAILKGFDITIIPFKKDDVSATIFPLKLFEYLGAGKPVIATDFNPDLKEFTKDTVYFCDDAKKFSRAISSCLENDTGALKQKRLAIAADNTWDIRVSELSNLINIFLIDNDVPAR